MLPRPRPIPLVRRLVGRALGALVVTAAVSSTVGCGGPNRWGYARNYEPLAPEKSALDGAQPFDATMAELKPEQWRNKKVHLWLIVDERKDAANGVVYLTGKMHVRNDVNGCANKHDEDTCRVTVKPGEGAVVHVQTTLVAEDQAGQLRVGKGTLLHVVGTVREKPDADDGKQVVDGAYYRQWPMGYYVSEGDLLQ
jgi:hypothetical protein